MKLDAYGETANERYTNTRGKATLAMKLNASSEAVYECLASVQGIATLGRISGKVLSSKLASRRS